MEKFFYYNELSSEKQISAQRSLVKYTEELINTIRHDKHNVYNPSYIEAFKEYTIVLEVSW